MPSGGSTSVVAFGSNTSGTANQTNGTWTFTSTGTYSLTPVTGGTLAITDGGGNEARSAYYNTVVPVGKFVSSFVYTASGAAGNEADGFTFLLQNDSRGLRALGGNGGALGYGTANAGTPISPSAAFELNIYSPSTLGYSFGTSGAVNANTTPGNVNLNSGDPIQVSLSYDGVNDLTVLMLDLTTGTAYSNTIAVGNLATIVGGSTAYVGFTGASGGAVAVQDFSSFTFS